MGKKLDALLGRGFKTNRFKATVNLAISRLAVLRNQHQARCSVAQSDVVQILNLGHHERALLRVEQVVKEQNILDVFTMIENYCYMLIERVSLLAHAKECPEELKEAISSLIYAATRCGEFPELQDLRAIFLSRFGKELVARAQQLRNNCGVNPKMIQKLSTRMPSMESRVKVLKDIALENNIVLQIEESDSVHSEVKMESEKKEDQPEAKRSNGSGDDEQVVNKPIVSEDEGMSNRYSDSMKMRGKYKDVAHAAQAAFESAAYAAAAARAAVELSQSDSHDFDGPKSPNMRPRKSADSPNHIETKHQSIEAKDSRIVKGRNSREGDHPLQNYDPDSEEHTSHAEHRLEIFRQNEEEVLFKRSLSTSSVESEDNNLKESEESSDEGGGIRPQGKKEVIFDDSDYETVDGGRLLLFKNHVKEPGMNHILQEDTDLSSEKVQTGKDEIVEESEIQMEKSLKSQAERGAESRPKNLQEHSYRDEDGDEDNLSRSKAPASVRTRRTYRR